MICHTDGCAAAQPHDEHGRQTSVQHDRITQPVLGATGHHLLNRQLDGTIKTHLQSWTGDALVRAHGNVYDEILRVEYYLYCLEQVRHALMRRAGEL